jgi:hypothetical protein
MWIKVNLTTSKQGFKEEGSWPIHNMGGAACILDLCNESKDSSDGKREVASMKNIDIVLHA